MDKLTRSFRALVRADTLIATIWAGTLGTQVVLGLLAGLIAIFGLGLINFTAYLALSPVTGVTLAALLLAIGDFIIAAMLLLIARSIKPGHDYALALEMRDNAIENLALLAKNPLDLAGNHLILPLMTGLVRGLRSKK
jgi:hypothetical protein